MNINVCILGLGNCSCSLIQGMHYYNDNSDLNGLIYTSIGGYTPQSINVVAAYDIDERKVNKDISEAIFSKPNCTHVFSPDVPLSNIQVKMGKILDGYPIHMGNYSDDESYIVADAVEPTEEDVVNHLIEKNVDVIINYLPVGSENATKFYVECALKANVAFVNCIPVFIASDEYWSERFTACNIPIIGDDIKSQLGATMVHRVLVDLFNKRGISLEKTYQINTGGNTDFLNMLDRERLSSKKISKTEAVQSANKKRIKDDNIHIGPSDYIPWLKDNKVCFIRMEGKLFGGIPMNLDVRLSVEDSPNSAGVAIDMIRFAKLAKDNNIGGVLIPPSAYYCKHPPVQHEDGSALTLLNQYMSDLTGTCLHDE